MDFFFKYEKVLLNSVWGVLLLGILGSLLGALIISLLKLLLRTVRERKDLILDYLVYKLTNPAEDTEKLTLRVQPSTNTSYITHTILEAAMLIIIAVSLLLSLSLLFFVSILFGLERPYITVSLLSLCILSSYFFLIQVLVCLNLSGEDFERICDHIENERPKSFKEWQNQRT